MFHVKHFWYHTRHTHNQHKIMFHVKHLLQDIVKLERETLYLDNDYSNNKEI